MPDRKTPKDHSDARPPIGAIGTGADLKSWYWRKDELIAGARAKGLKTTGGKFQILDRIAHFLDTGEREAPGDAKTKVASKFDWHSEPLSPDTVITDSYRNSQNVRRFFRSKLGEGFKFNIEFMGWMKSNVGRTLDDACDEYRAMKAREAAPDFQSVIAEHNQFNQYTRDFLSDNPDLGMEDVRRCWSRKIKRRSEDGRHRYERSDLDLK